MEKIKIEREAFVLDKYEIEKMRTVLLYAKDRSTRKCDDERIDIGFINYMLHNLE